MDVGTVIGLVLSSTVIEGLLSGYLSMQSDKETNDINLLDRAYKEIERLDGQVLEKDNIIVEKNKIIARLEKAKAH